MDEDYLNFAFNTLYESYGRFFSDEEMASMAIHKEVAYPIENTRILLQLHKDGFADLVVYDTVPALKKSFYSLSSKGTSFIYSLPEEFKGRPYSYHLHLLKVERDAKNEKERLELLQLQSNIDTNNNVTASLSFQRFSSKISILLGIVSTGFIAATVIQQSSDPTPKKLDLIKEELTTSRRSIDSIRFALMAIDSTLNKQKFDSAK